MNKTQETLRPRGNALFDYLNNPTTPPIETVELIESIIPEGCHSMKELTELMACTTVLGQLSQNERASRAFEQFSIKAAGAMDAVTLFLIDSEAKYSFLSQYGGNMGTLLVLLSDERPQR
jgi:hypothetical protein